VRVAYTAILLLALWTPLNWLFWVPGIGTLAQVLFGYCFLARCLSLLPWNRSEPLSWSLIWRTYISPPVKGNILQGLPATPSPSGRVPAAFSLGGPDYCRLGEKMSRLPAAH
jgi:hypothetical protein